MFTIPLHFSSGVMEGAIVGAKKLVVDRDGKWIFIHDTTIPTNVTFVSVLNMPAKFLRLPPVSSRNFQTVVFESPSTIQILTSNLFCLTSLRSIRIPASVQIIERECFYKSELSAITFEHNSRLQHIGERAFACTNIATFTVPASVQMIQRSAFAGVWLSIDSSNTLKFLFVEAGSQLFVLQDQMLYAGSITTLIVPRSVQRINNSCFSNCKLLREVTFEADSSCRVLGQRAFALCERLGVRIHLPASVEEIHSQCFFSCQHLFAVDFGESTRARRIASDAFQGTYVDVTLIPNRQIVPPGYRS